MLAKIVCYALVSAVLVQSLRTRRQDDTSQDENEAPANETEAANESTTEAAPGFFDDIPELIKQEVVENVVEKAIDKGFKVVGNKFKKTTTPEAEETATHKSTTRRVKTKATTTKATTSKSKTKKLTTKRSHNRTTRKKKKN